METLTLPTVDFATGQLQGPGIVSTLRTLGDLAGVFADTEAWRKMEISTPVYRVQTLLPVPEGTAGGVYWGTTFIEPGKVGREYFMTRGHFHALTDRTEIYIGVAGEGALILMDEERRTSFEPMRRGSIHHIRGGLAHRVANTGEGPLSFLAAWPSDAGHDYESIARSGFSARLVEVAGGPVLVPEVLP